MLYACGQAKQTYSRNGSRGESSPRAKRKENIIIITRRKRRRTKERERWSRGSRALWTLGSGWKVCCIVVASRQLSLPLSSSLSLCLTAVFPGCLRIFDFNANKPKPQRERKRENERESAINWQWQPQTKKTFPFCLETPHLSTQRSNNNNNN